MLELVLIRHGETKSNYESRYIGFIDEELNDRGIQQSQSLKDKLKDEIIDGIFSSPLKRALKTAEIINEAHGSQIIKDDKLKERNFGVFEGLRYEEICNWYPDERKKWDDNWKEYDILNGESASRFHKRVCVFLRRFTGEVKDGKYIFVTHSGVIRSMVACLLNMEMDSVWHFKVDNCCVSRFEIENGFAVIKIFNG